MTTRYRANSPNVIHETIEGEVILIDLGSGTYYSLREAGAAAWAAVANGASEEAVVAAVQARYDGPEAEIREAVGRLVAELEREGLIRADGTAEAAAAVEPAQGPDRAPFQPPVLEKHTDMQDLILLDPVHEVGAAGWPQPAPPDEAMK
jgi:hypothetical protein